MPDPAGQADRMTLALSQPLLQVWAEHIIPQLGSVRDVQNVLLTCSQLRRVVLQDLSVSTWGRLAASSFPELHPVRQVHTTISALSAFQHSDSADAAGMRPRMPRKASTIYVVHLLGYLSVPTSTAQA